MARSDTTLKWIVIGLVILIGAAYMGYIQIPGINFKQQAIVQQGGEAGGVAVTKPLKIAVIDKWQGSAVASATIKIYKGQTLMETLTTDASGLATTALSYKSGEQLYLHISKGSAEVWVPLTVPYMSESDAQSLTVNPVNVEFYTLGSFSIQVMDGDGNSYTTGGTLNFTALGKNVVTLTITIYNTLDNSGFMESYNPVLGEKRAAYLIAEFSGTGYDVLGITGFQYSKETASKRVFFNHIVDDELVKYKVGNTYQKDGVTSITITIDGSALTAGQSVTMSITLKLFADGDKYLSSNVWSSETSVDAATFTLTLTK